VKKETGMEFARFLLVFRALQEAIFFSYDTGGDESGLGSSDTILITHFPAQKKG
jgi:hypothetical protein